MTARRRRSTQRRNRLARRSQPEDWELRFQPHDRVPMEAEATVEAAGNHRGQPGEVRWLQHEHTNADQRSSTEPSLSVDLPHGRPGGMGDISDRLRHVVEMVAGLLAADGGALVLVNQDGAVRSAMRRAGPRICSARSSRTSERDPVWTRATRGNRWPRTMWGSGCGGCNLVRSRPAMACGRCWLPHSGSTGERWGR
jgi:hypothetical protein